MFSFINLESYLSWCHIIKSINMVCSTTQKTDGVHSIDVRVKVERRRHFLFQVSWRCSAWFAPSVTLFVKWGRWIRWAPASMVYAISPGNRCLGSSSSGENFGPKDLNIFTEVKRKPERSLIKLNVLMFECWHTPSYLGLREFLKISPMGE